MLFKAEDISYYVCFGCLYKSKMTYIEPKLENLYFLFFSCTAIDFFL